MGTACSGKYFSPDISENHYHATMPIITLLTDFGTDDEYVGVMKGVMLSICPSASVVDISHHVAPHDVGAAAYLLGSYPQYFPAGTVHVVVVDPGVGTQRSIVAVSFGGQILLAPDNGVATVLLQKITPEALIRVEAPAYCLAPVGRTFQGRDVFAPIAAHLTAGIDLNQLGPRLAPEALVGLEITKPHMAENNELVGRIVAVDRFGNLITDIDTGLLDEFGFAAKDLQVEVRIGSGRIQGISDTYADVAPRKPLAVVGSRGCLEIAVNQGSAREYFEAKPGDAIRIKTAG